MVFRFQGIIDGADLFMLMLLLEKYQIITYSDFTFQTTMSGFGPSAFILRYDDQMPALNSVSFYGYIYG